MKFIPALLCCALLAGAGYAHAAEQKPSDTTKSRPSQPKTPAKAQGYKEIGWDELVPKDWNPLAMMQGFNLDEMDDNDPRAMELIEKMRRVWDEAPVKSSLNGARIRIPGYLVPLDAQRGQLKEFLLVPYFGACIHTPPPPANQIIHGVAAKPLGNVELMAAVWISGTLETVRSETEFGASGYRLKAENMTLYKEGDER